MARQEGKRPGLGPQKANETKGLPPGLNFRPSKGPHPQCEKVHRKHLPIVYVSNKEPSSSIAASCLGRNSPPRVCSYGLYLSLGLYQQERWGCPRQDTKLILGRWYSITFYFMFFYLEEEDNDND
jgi:hypothetical protein